MEFTPALQPATLIKRYKRFLADVITPDGNTLTLHCPNTGAMTGCATPGDTVWYSTSVSRTRKYPHTWELTQTQNGDTICVNTLRANTVIKEAIGNGLINQLTGYKEILSEVKYGNERSRIDFMLQAQDKVNCYIEVKSVTLAEQNNGFFPDAVTTRGQKHLRELMSVARGGERAVLLFTVLHSAIENVAAARHIDSQYAQLLHIAAQHGVEVMAWKALVNPAEIRLISPLPVYL